MFTCFGSCDRMSLWCAVRFCESESDTSSLLQNAGLCFDGDILEANREVRVMCSTFSLEYKTIGKLIAKVIEVMRQSGD